MFFFGRDLMIFSKKIGESILIDKDIYVTILGMDGNEVRLGIDTRSAARVKNEEFQTISQFESCRKGNKQNG
jgi:carbon storage regulator